MELRNRKWIPVAIVLLAGVTLVTSGFIFREDLWLEWCRRRVEAECREGASLKDEPSAAWRELERSGEAGCRRFARILRSPESAVWARAAAAIASHRDLLRSCIPFLRLHDPEALIRYKIIQSDLHSNEIGEEGNLFSRYYWSGNLREPLAASPGAVDFCAAVLAGAVDLSALPTEIRGPFWIRNRALNALGSMLESGEVRGKGSGRDPLHRGIIELLAEASRRLPDPSLRLAALNNLALRTAAGEEGYAASLAEWIEVAETSPGLASGEEKNLNLCTHPGSLLALVHLDDPAGLEIIARLGENPLFAAILRRSLSLNPADDPMPVPLPRWDPPLEAAKRFLSRSAADRAEAAVQIAIFRWEGSGAAVREVLSKEPDGELRLLLEASLAALGDTALRESVALELERRIAADLAPPSGAPSSGPPAEIPWPSTRDVARCLLASGEVRILARVVEWITLAPRQRFLDLGEFVAEFRVETPLDESQPPLVAEYLEGVRQWWQGAKGSIHWDASRKRFVWKRIVE